ncbi:MAG: hypothetical protein NC243_10655 [Lachnoclostridium sp.]|nr:hypothetical protein [Lachnoclostridium sp.]MCM1384988.1 hypothetical protein [Lachnoclostridium sp.]
MESTQPIALKRMENLSHSGKNPQADSSELVQIHGLLVPPLAAWREA